PICRRIVLLNERLIVSAARRTPKHINLSSDGSDRHLATRFAKPRLFGPFPLARSLRSCRERWHKANPDNCREDRKAFHIVRARIALLLRFNGDACALPSERETASAAPSPP